MPRPTSPTSSTAARLAAERGGAIGLFDKIKRLRLDAAQAEDPSREIGDLIEPGSYLDASGVPPDGGGAAALEQLQGLHASGLIDAETLASIEATMAGASAQLEQLHASGAMSDEIYAQAMASMPGAGSGGGSVSAADLDLLLNGEPATATVLSAPEPADGADGRLRLKLEVHPASGSPYAVESTFAAVHPGGEPKPGDFLQVMVDPKDPKRVAVDWA